MPFTVITLKRVPQALRGDLTKWMQEIVTGVYVGNFNSRIRENLWKRIQDAVGDGEATMSYTCRNEIGYEFQTLNADRQVVDYDGIPLVMIPLKQQDHTENNKMTGYSNAYKMHQARRFVAKKSTDNANPVPEGYVVLDLETTGLDVEKDKIIEIGALKIEGEKIERFQVLIQCESPISKAIEDLTGISSDLLNREGQDLEDALVQFRKFIGTYKLIGYNIAFDLKFLNAYLKEYCMPEITNQLQDLMKIIKKEQLFQKDYKLQTSLRAYGINKKVPHRALEDAELVYELLMKVNKINNRGI